MTDHFDEFDSSAFDAIARRFFNEFLELKVQLETGKVSKPKNYDRELATYKKAAEQFKKAAQDLAEQNKQLEESLALAEEALVKERGRVNELLISHAALAEKLQGLGVIRREIRETGYSFREHLSEDSKRALDSLMREIPYRGTKDNDV